MPRLRPDCHTRGLRGWHVDKDWQEFIGPFHFGRISGLYAHIDTVGDESEWLGCWVGFGGDAIFQKVVKRDACGRLEPLVSLGCGLVSDLGVAPH